MTIGRSGTARFRRVRRARLAPVVTVGTAALVLATLGGLASPASAVSLNPPQPSDETVVGNTLQWTAPAWGGGTIASYVVGYRPVGQTSWGIFAKGANLTSVVLDAGGAGTACSAANASWSDCRMPYGWNPLTEYEFAVYSRSDAGKNSMGPLTAADTAFGVYGFEDGVQGWAGDGGITVAQDTTVVSEGTHSLLINNTAGFNWVKSPELATGVDVSGESTLKLDVKNPTGFGVNVTTAITGGTWCQKTNTGFIPAGTTQTVVVDLSGCGVLSWVNGIWVAISNASGGDGTGTFYIDNVRFQPAAPVLYGFEIDDDDWTGAGATVAQSTAFHTEGSTGLEAVVTGGAWSSAVSSTVPLTGNLTATPLLSLDVQNASGAGGQVAVGIKSGAESSWCTAPAVWLNNGESRNVTVDLSTVSCGSKDLTDVRGILVQFGANGTFRIDNVRVEPLG